MNEEDGDTAALLPLDGFHFDDLYLEPAGLRPRKGAPETFDVAGFAHALRRLRACQEPLVAVPGFDRNMEIDPAGARLIPDSARIVGTEGNYLLLDLAPCFDLTEFLKVPAAELERRLIRRWPDHGFGDGPAREKALGNDISNLRLVATAPHSADITRHPS